ncbi:PTS sugar transporter subunit IIA [Anaerorhabdus sp.]|uniref:PTS sugar transporter subunit IIA n=1 Tax=Anaerorhabdus sp. TaxID=1872524 RepID=UPI002FC6C59D
MLKNMISQELITLNVEATDWQDAIRKAAIPLVQEGKIKESYVDGIIRAVHEIGDNDPVKYIFTLSAVDNNAHLEALSDLAGLLEQQEFYDFLDNAKSPEEVMNYINAI